ncbi:MAG: ribonuclease E/G [Streptomycetaceae bacterium]|nr:ribonuclease E/G [Streptomycetaceae bacterium]
MLENPEPGNEAPQAPDTQEPGASAGSETTQSAPRRRRRAASRPAGPPAAADEAVDVSTSEAETVAEAVTSAAGAAGSARTRRRATRKATVEEPAEAEAVEKPRRTRKRVSAVESRQTAEESRRLKPGALAPKEEAAEHTAEAAPEPVAAPEAEAVTSEAVTSKTGAAGPARTRRRKATAPAGSPSFTHVHAEVVDEPAEEGTLAGFARAVRPPTAVFQPPVFTVPELPTSVVKPVVKPVVKAAVEVAEPAEEEAEAEEGREEEVEAEERPSARRRRRGGRRRRRGEAIEGEEVSAEEEPSTEESCEAEAEAEVEVEQGEPAAGTVTSRRRRRRRRRSGEPAAEAEQVADEDGVRTVVKVREPRERRKEAEPSDEVQSIKGSTRLEAKKQRRREGREQGRRRVPIITEAEFLARREAVERVMVVRENGERTQIGVLEDDVLVEHFVNKEQATSYVGNVYLGKVQNVLPSMEAAFVDIGKGRNAVLYAGEVNFEALGLVGGPRRIESALKSGQSVLVQVTKDPIGHKGARLTSQVSLPGRYLVYVPEGSMTGISRKLPDTERARLKQILKKIVPEDAGVIVRTAAEGASEEELQRDVTRLQAQWEEIQKKAKNGGNASAPSLLYGEPDMTVRVVRDIFNEDFSKVIISGDNAWETVHGYVSNVAPDLTGRLQKWTSEVDVFATYRIDEQLLKALDRKVWLPSGGSLVIDRTEAMVVIDVNTGKFTGQGGNLEETVTRNNLEAAEEIVRQLRLRDLGGIIVIDFIDMVLESNRDLVMRRLLECLGRDRTKHQVAEVTSLGLIQMTRKRVGQGLLESFSEMCAHCNGRGVIVHMDQATTNGGGGGKRKRKGRAAIEPALTPTAAEALEEPQAESPDGEVSEPEPEPESMPELIEPVAVTPAAGDEDEDEEWFGSVTEAEAAAASRGRRRRRGPRAASSPAGPPKAAEAAEAQVVVVEKLEKPVEEPVAEAAEPEPEPVPARTRRRATRKATAPAGSPKVADEPAEAEIVVVPSAEKPPEQPEAAEKPEAVAAEVAEPQPLRRRAARKATAPAGPPPSAEGEAVIVVPAVSEAEAEAEPNKRTRKTTAKKAAAKKTTAKKTAAKTAVAKTAVAKTTVAKTTAAKTTVAKTTAAKKTTKKAAAKKSTKTAAAPQTPPAAISATADE